MSGRGWEPSSRASPCWARSTTAARGTRTITFAPEIVYREDADPEEERRRVAAVCEAEMNRIWQEQHGAQENSCPADEGK